MMEFRSHYVGAGGNEDDAFDAQVCQKVLPRIHGSKRELSVGLKNLAAFCFFGPGVSIDDDFDVETADPTKAKLTLSFDKVARMWRRLQETHFVSFAE